MKNVLISLPFRVGIIGGGISGASTAAFVHQLAHQVGENVEIEVFEKSSLPGGRIGNIHFQDETGQSK